jgi:hypothetical protein
MSTHWRTALKFFFTAALLLLAGRFFYQRVADLRRGGEDGARVWFYDQSARRLYAALREAVPPDRGIDSVKGDGVRAVVILFRGDHDQPASRRIAYLETYTPELKSRLDRARVARESGTVPAEPLPARSSDYFLTNTLVKRVDDSEWHTLTSSNGRKILSEWHSWRSPDGRTPVVCLP